MGVSLLDVNGIEVGFTTTISFTGIYSFSVPAGTSVVNFITPADYGFSPQNQGGDPELESDADVDTG